MPASNRGPAALNDELQLSERGAALVKSFEGCLQPANPQKTLFHPYYALPHDLTIGWGHTNDNGRKFRKGDVWTKGARLMQSFRGDTKRFEAGVKRRVKVALTKISVRCTGVLPTIVAIAICRNRACFAS